MFDLWGRYIDYLRKNSSDNHIRYMNGIKRIDNTKTLVALKTR